MRKFAKKILFALIAYLIVSGLAVWLLPKCCPLLRRLDIVEVAIQFLSAISTLAAVLWALFGASFLSKIRCSSLSLHLEKSQEYCYLVKDAAEMPGENRTRLGIFGRVSNASSVDAEACRVVANEVFASSDGVKFSRFQKVCTVGFSWVYEGDDKTTIRKGVDKHFSFVELLEKNTLPQKSPDGKIAKPGGRSISIFVCIPNFVNGQERFEVGPDYKGVMVPISLVSRTEDVKVYYLKIVWLGTDLNDYMTADKLKVMVLSEAEAKQDIV